MKKYKDLYKEEKQRHDEALQRYQEDHPDEMEIINLHKKCNKNARKVSQKKHYQMNLKKYQGPLMIQAGKNRSLKKHQAMEKRPLQTQEKKHQNHLNLLTQARKKKKGCLKIIKRKKYLLCWG